MSESNAPEPTMEEILASIRRIISEDEPAETPAAPEPIVDPLEEAPAAAAAPPAALEHDDVLELTELAPEPDPFASTPVETLGDLEVHAAAEPAAPPPPAAPPRTEEALMSDAPAATAASAFIHLAHTVAMPAEGRVLEDVVRELLRPLLKVWLDEHLPAIVQAKVDEEVERIARRRMG